MLGRMAVQTTDRDPILTICLLAAAADGKRATAEREQLDRVVAALGAAGLAERSREILEGRVRLSTVAARLSSEEARRFAYEMAVCICDADGAANRQETAFLSELRGVLGMAPAAVAEHTRTSAALGGARPGGAPVATGVTLDDGIRKHAMIAGALELLPQGIASLAIIPLQMKLVHKIGEHHGRKLDGQQVHDLLGAMGIGVVAQMLDAAARRLLGRLGRGVLGRSLGGVAGGAAGAALGAGTAFVTTYALGHAADQYYTQGRKLSAGDLKALVARFRGEAEELLPKVLSEIEHQSQSLDLNHLLTSLKAW